MSSPLPMKHAVIWLVLSLCAVSANGQQRFFEPVPGLRIATSVAKNVQKFTLYQLKEADLRSHLATAPLEFQATGAPVMLLIPLPNGTTESFAMRESPILSPAVAANHPEIKTYTGTGKTHPAYTIRMSFTGSGFDAIILGVDSDAVYYTKVSTDPTDRLYMTYFARDAQKPATTTPATNGNKCGSAGPGHDLAHPSATDKQGRMGALNNTGTALRTFRLAVAATGEFTQQKGGGNVNTAFAALVGYVNRMNAVYRVELSVAFTLVSDVNVVYPNPATDPFTNTDQIKMLDENQVVLDNAPGIGNAGYDVGHVFSYEGGSGGGIASSPSTCNNAYKGKGVSGMGNPAQYAPVFDDQLVSHEVGHQFSMSHSFNSSIPVCTTREATTSVEPGAGATIMSYGFTCSGAPGDDNYETPAYAPFLNFHGANYTQAATYINTLTCFTSTALPNAVPTIGTFPVNVTVPKSTPFVLEGTANDANGSDVLSYSWEGTNIGTVVPDGTTLANTAQPPFFRSYMPVSTGTRYYPRLSAILDGSNYAKGDKLPSTGATTTHRLTVRDNVGGLTHQTVTVTVDGSSGPFVVTSNLAASYEGNSTQTITWDVANTTAPPVNCANVDILLSTDGGQTFPTTLLANTPNDGSEPITLPAVLSTTARIKVRGSNTIFFDISNTNFTITSPLPVELVYFRAEPAVDQVRLSWSTASERNSERFTVERSQNLGEFVAIGSVAAAGESVRLLGYGLNDVRPLAGTSYYRLVQLDRDGQAKVSKPVSVVLDEAAPLLLVSPNPASATQIQYQLINMPAPTVSLMTLTGKPVAVQSITSDGTGNHVLKTAGTLPAGVYILRADSELGRKTQRIVVAD